MPQTSTKPHSICNEFGCNNLTKESYCEEHQHIQIEKELKRHRYYNTNRDPAVIRFYNSKEWRALSEYVRAKNHYLCIQCDLSPADLTDHIIPIEVDWSKRLDVNNCQPLCHDCHNKKTAEDKKKFGRGRSKVSQEKL
ncbi:HNH endonuclease [Virgibacillus oceani]